MGLVLEVRDQNFDFKLDNFNLEMLCMWTSLIFVGWVSISQVGGLGVGGLAPKFACGILVIMIRIASPNQVKIRPINIVQSK
jgi:hypothetical protein